ncbi:hypothetical protein [uncultured Methanobrevibacter sp.]|uniref:hypothetical protein n=1 Tax=uncultured Methanobrevibacter sp. TaxID=253161 RepID=UPI0025D0344C|nr:hypothetical protein [uncultured Methanobrevibacter sp.]
MLSSIINKEIFNCYACIGTFSFKDKEFTSEFYLVQYNDGKIDLIIGGFFTFLFMERFSVKDDYCSISAKLLYGSASVRIDEAVIANISVNSGNSKPTYAILNVYNPITIESNNYEEFNHDTILVYLTNFLNNPTSQGDFQKFNIENNNYLIEFKGIHDYDEYKTLLYERKEDVLITSMAKINLKNKDVDIVGEMDKLTYLISYINRTHISPVCFNFYDNGNLIKSILYPALTTKFSNKEKLIETNNIKYFIEKCYPIFLENYQDFSLNIVISIYLESLLSNYIDSSYILLVTSLESFLLSHEDQCIKNGEIINPSSIKRIKKDIVKFLDRKDYDIIEEDLEELSEMLAYKNTTLGEKFSLLKNKDKFGSNLNLKPEDYDFPTIRNKIIHTGKVPKEINSSKGERKINMAVEYNRTLFLLDKIILSLLEYDGVFNDYLNKTQVRLG